MPQPEVAALLTDHAITGVFECAGQPVSGHAARQLHAASTGISSSFT